MLKKNSSKLSKSGKYNFFQNFLVLFIRKKCVEHLKTFFFELCHDFFGKSWFYTNFWLKHAAWNESCVATLLPFCTAIWNLKTRRNAADACVNGKWQLSFKQTFWDNLMYFVSFNTFYTRIFGIPSFFSANHINNIYMSQAFAEIRHFRKCLGSFRNI